MDDESLNYLRYTGRDEKHIQLVERYMKEQDLFLSTDSPIPDFTDIVELDMSTVEPSLAGPKRPQDRISMSQMKKSFTASLTAPTQQRGFELAEDQVQKKATIEMNGESNTVGHGFVAIASITSCTNTSNPSVMLGAGLLAKKAVDAGLKVPSYVKTSLAPGSRVVTEYLDDAGLTPYLDKLGFHTIGYGCASCIGNSGPLPEEAAKTIEDNDLIAAAVLSGNRNFEGRVNPLTRANYLASPPLVVAYAIAGRMDIDLDREPLGANEKGEPVYLKDVWPTAEDFDAVIDKANDPQKFIEIYKDVNAFTPMWKEIPTSTGAIYDWQEKSTYVQEPPFFVNLAPEVAPIQPINGARVLALLGDSVTTDHISPAGAIPKDSPAAKYLMDNGVEPRDFNSYGSRRGNDRVMVRGTFGNIRLKNLLVPGVEGGLTLHLPEGEQMWIYDAAARYKKENTQLIILAGKEYGAGSSRDWAAKGTLLLGVKAVIAESYERIHRSNLVGMGVLPLQFKGNYNAQTHGLTGHEVFDFVVNDAIKPMQDVAVIARNPDGSTKSFNVIARLDTPVEIDYYRNGGILHTVLRNMLKE